MAHFYNADATVCGMLMRGAKGKERQGEIDGSNRATD
jgi:hypothetical protein